MEGCILEQKHIFINNTVSLVQTISVTEMANENNIVKLLIKIFLYYFNIKHLSSCQIDVNESMAESVRNSLIC